MSAMAQNRRKERSVALLIETSNRYSRELLHGIRDYMQGEGRYWAVHLTEQGRGDIPPPWLKRWQGHGIIARIENRRIEKAARQTGVPMVSVSASGLARDVPTVISDSEAVARMAAEHLIDRGFRNFGYCGDARFTWSNEHGKHFERTLRQAGYSCSHFPSLKNDHTNWLTEQRKIAAWLKTLPKPVGVMTCYDIRGQQVLDVCRQRGFPVPDEVGVIGQHDDRLLCELCDPPLSSVIPNPRQAGYQAAGLLDKMMDGQDVAAKIYPIAPIGTATRHSTDLVAIDDPAISAAIRFIQANALEGIHVSDVLQAVPMSRTLLERKFQRYLNRSPYEMIQRIRFQHAEELLLKTDLSVSEIAQRSGFLTPEYFSAIFKKRVGVSPRAYRQQSRGA